MRPKLLDLYCGAGGAGVGYHRAGFDVTGVDLNPQPNYPFTFHQVDALEYLAEHGHRFDAIHASPPCQRYSKSTRRWGTNDSHPDLVEPTRDLLRASGRTYVIENVPGAPLVDPTVLCGSMFGLRLDGGRYLRRHRLFESNVPLAPPPSCDHTGLAVGVYGHPGGSSQRDGLTFGSFAMWQAVMGVDWMTVRELGQSIPPAFTTWVGDQL